MFEIDIDTNESTTKRKSSTIMQKASNTIYKALSK